MQTGVSVSLLTPLRLSVSLLCATLVKILHRFPFPMVVNCSRIMGEHDRKDHADAERINLLHCINETIEICDETHLFPSAD